MTPASETQPPLGRPFVAGYTLAQIGAFIGFVPLLSVLLPLKAAAVASTSAAVLLSHAAILGALAAGVSHFLTGLVSDHTRSRFGRRRPWIIAGALAVVASYGGVFLASGPLELILAIVFFQIAFNIMFSPLMAVFADKVPDAGKGMMSAFGGLAFPTANLFAALVIASLVPLGNTGGSNVSAFRAMPVPADLEALLTDAPRRDWRAVAAAAARAGESFGGRNTHR